MAEGRARGPQRVRGMNCEGVLIETWVVSMDQTMWLHSRHLAGDPSSTEFFPQGTDRRPYVPPRASAEPEPIEDEMERADG